MTGLDSSARSALERLITKARRILEDDLAATAEGRFGIHKNGKVEEEDSLRLAPAEVLDRREVVAIVSHLRLEGVSASSAVERLVREATFTHLNRLVAIRIAESIGILPPSLTAGKASRGFREVLEIAPLVASDQYGGYWFYLRLCADELAADAPLLFDPRNPLLALAPSPHGLDELVALLGDPAMGEAWLAPDALGWAYQFFNTGDERREMREAGAPRTSRELAVRNQFFTPQYVVDFLVQNSLGRRLLEGSASSALAFDMPLLVDEPVPSGDPLSLEQVRVLDPACGSGHFLLGAYDLLEKAWEHNGVPPAEAAVKILPCLYGIDIDPRCAQVASAALMLRARRVCPSGSLPHPEVLTARALPRDDDVWARVLVELPPERQSLVRALQDALSEAPLLGPLLKVEERMAAEIRQAIPEAVPDQLWYRPDALANAEIEVLAILDRIADESMSTTAERLLAAETGDAIRFVEAMRRRYDIVLMNPPFGEPVPETKEYLRAAYPSGKDNLLGAFVARGVELCRSGGYVGAITSRAAMFLKTFERWRKENLIGHRLVLVDLGYGVMEQAMVEAAAYVVSAEPRAEAQVTCIRLLREADRPGALYEAAERLRSGTDDRVFRLAASDLEAIPGSPLAYWIVQSVRRLFGEFPPVEGNGASVRAGLCTGDDFRFVRCAWEVDPRRIARSRDETFRGGRWVPFAKGGDYSPFWSDLHLVVDWAEDGASMRNAPEPGTRVQNAGYYFKDGLTWPLRTASGFGCRVLPAGAIFGHKGPAMVPMQGVPANLLIAWMTSRIVAACMAALVAAGEETTSGAAAKSYEVGLVQKVPWPPSLLAAPTTALIADSAAKLMELRMSADSDDETSRRFVAARVVRSGIRNAAERRVNARENDAISAIAESWRSEQLLKSVVGLDDAGDRYLDAETGHHPECLPRTPLDPKDDLRLQRWYQMPLDAAIDEVVAERGGSRSIVNMVFVADRRLEVLSHALDRHPSVIRDGRARLGLLPPDEPLRSAEDLLSYLVGVAFGRWDVRIGRDPEAAPAQPEPLEEVHRCPPGMLVAEDGLPVHHAPAGYPIELPPDGLILDEPGHPFDLESVVRQAAEVLLEDAETTLDEIASILGRPLRDQFRRRFFRDHLSRYSKSRRQAPIYWWLSVPSRNWGVWVYAPAISREMLFAVGRHAARRVGVGRDVLVALRADHDAGGRGRPLREISTRIAEEEDLVAELEVFRAEAERVAGLGWEPNLDDGMVLCAAPLASLFPAWPAAAEERHKLKTGEYKWATVSKWAASL